ncbi:MAG: hypothetical protein OXU20_24330 [Myxococcales bacterium]|nr:hypothetical protein [Myxococcales bacterium]MDD9970524.1 hypothetical protein [Myxococcales bacterium]
MSAILRPAALSEGSLASDPFVHLLLAALEQRFQGSLVVWSGEQPFAANAAQQRLLFEEGVVVAGDLDGDDRNLFSALIPLTVRRGGGYRFLPRVNVVGDDRRVLRGHVDPFMLAASALRGPVREDVIDAVVQEAGGRVLQVRSTARFERLGLTRDEWNFVQDLRRRPASAPALMVRGNAPEHFTKRMIYLLRVTGMAAVLPVGRQAPSRAVSVPGPPPPERESAVHSTAPPRVGYDPRELDGLRLVASGPGQEPSGSNGPTLRPVPDPPELSVDMPFSDPGPLLRRPAANDTRPIRIRIPSEPPVALSEGMAYRYRQIVRHHQRMRTRNLFELLGVGPEDNDEAIRDAYTVLAAQWRHEGLSPELAMLAPLVEEITAGLAEAFETLTDERRRYEYIERLRNGDGRLLSLSRSEGSDTLAARPFAR